MVNHKGWVAEEFVLNGHEGYRFYNETTGTHSIMCSTCFAPTPSFPTCPSTIDEWGERGRRGPRPLAWERHADPLNHPRAGEVYDWEDMTYKVIRVSETGRWADIRVTPLAGEGWSKRQPLPLPPGSVRKPAVIVGAPVILPDVPDLDSEPAR